MTQPPAEQHPPTPISTETAEPLPGRESSAALAEQELEAALEHDPTTIGPEAEPSAVSETEAAAEPESSAEPDRESETESAGATETGAYTETESRDSDTETGAVTGTEFRGESDFATESRHSDTENGPETESGGAGETEADAGRDFRGESDFATESRETGTGGEAAPEEIETDEVEPDELAEDAKLESVLESLLLVVDEPVAEDTLAQTLNQPAKRITTTLRRMSDRYTAALSGIDLRRFGEGWRFYTRDINAPYVERLLLDGQRSKLTRAALETLAVIAYRQPVTRSRVSAVRGVNVDGVMRTLLARGLVEEVGTDTDTQGTLHRTTELFLERIGLSSLDELPPIAPLLPEVDSIDDLD